MIGAWVILSGLESVLNISPASIIEKKDAKPAKVHEGAKVKDTPVVPRPGSAKM